MCEVRWYEVSPGGGVGVDGEGGDVRAVGRQGVRITLLTVHRGHVSRPWVTTAQGVSGEEGCQSEGKVLR